MSRKVIIGLGLASIVIILVIYLNTVKKDETEPPSAAKTRTITDMKNRKVVIADPLERIALLGGPTGQVAFILGVQDKLCAVTNTLRMSKLVQEIYPGIKELPGPRTTAGSINIEELIRSDPQVVISTPIDGEIVEAKTRIPAAFLDDDMGGGISDIKKEIRFYGVVCNASKRAENYIRNLDALIGLVRERTKDIPDDKRKKIFQGYSPSHLVTLGGDTFMQERIELAGCINAARSVTTIGKRTGLHSGLGEVSMEQVIDWNPDILIINYGSLEDLKKDPQWQHIKAVQEGKVYAQPAGIFIFNRPTAESAAIFPLWLASTAYPERFEDIDVKFRVKEFYSNVMEISLSDTQIRDVLNGSYEFKMMKGIKHIR